MLSVAGRAALRRLGSRIAATPSRAVVISKLTAPASQGHALKTLQTVRLYASVGRPKGSTTKASTTKKPAAKKTTAKTKAKAKPAKKTAAAKKPKARKVAPKKPATPESAARQQVKIRQELKRTALFTEPKRVPESAWRVYVAENLKGKSGEFKDQAAKLAAVAEGFKSLSYSEQQRYASIAEENHRANAAAYKAWVESHTIEQMNAANNARLRLKRDFSYPKGNPKTIKDDRIPKHPVTAYAFFTKAKWASGELSRGSSDSLSATASTISAEWKNLSASERQPYEDLARAESQRYEKEYEAAFGRKPATKKLSPEA